MIFGDYQTMYGMKSNIIFKTGKKNELVAQAELEQKMKNDDDLNSALKVNMMCINLDRWNDICELYPKTFDRLKDMAIVKREIILHYMEKSVEMDHDRGQTGIPATLSSRRDHLKAVPEKKIKVNFARGDQNSHPSVPTLTSEVQLEDAFDNTRTAQSVEEIH